MFKFFKKKISEAVDKFSKQADEEGEEITVEEEVTQDTQEQASTPDKKAESENISHGDETVDKKKSDSLASSKEEDSDSEESSEDEETHSEKKEKKGFFSKIFGKKDDGQEDKDLEDKGLEDKDLEDEDLEDKDLDADNQDDTDDVEPDSKEDSEEREELSDELEKAEELSVKSNDDFEEESVEKEEFQSESDESEYEEDTELDDIVPPKSPPKKDSDTDTVSEENDTTNAASDESDTTEIDFKDTSDDAQDDESNSEPLGEDKPKKKGLWGRIFGKNDEESDSKTDKKPEIEKDDDSEKEGVSLPEIKSPLEKEDEPKTGKQSGADEEVEETKISDKPVEPEEKLAILSEEDSNKDSKESSEEKPVEEKKEGFFSKITKSFTYKKISQHKFDDLFWELELTMLENNVAVEVIEKIKEDLSKELVDKPIQRNKITDSIMKSLASSINDLFDVEQFDLLKKVEEKKPYVICFIGINGSGKTTTIAKMVRHFQKNNKSVVLAAGDTFRAAAIDQLQLHADNLGVRLIKHDYGSDAAAVAFDAVKHAEAKGKDIVLIDTAGRIHSNKNLMDELKKVIRVARPDLKIFIGESITGNDCVEQAKEFNDAVGIDAIILSKADIDEKGGAAISVSHITKRPILYLGTGQDYDDLQPFDKDKLMKDLGLA
jgi:fused signal recognition particle receptor